MRKAWLSAALLFSLGVSGPALLRATEKNSNEETQQDARRKALDAEIARLRLELANATEASDDPGGRKERLKALIEQRRQLGGSQETRTDPPPKTKPNSTGTRNRGGTGRGAIGGRDGATGVDTGEETGTTLSEDERRRQEEEARARSEQLGSAGTQALGNLQQGAGTFTAPPPGAENIPGAGGEGGSLGGGPGGAGSESGPGAGAAGLGSGAGRALQGAAGGAALLQGPSDPSNPANERDLALASMMGFGGAFSGMGLKAGRGPDGASAILRADGLPASRGEIESLASKIRSEPRALMQRPDFFSALPRERFNDLKQEFRGSPGRRDADFRHIGMTSADRDFQFSQSCSPLAGDCNPHLARRSYQKGKFVPPEDLDKIWKGIKEIAQGEDRAEAKRRGEYEEARKKLSRGLFSGSSMMQKFGNLFGALGRLAGRSAVDASSAPQAAGAPARGAWARFWSRGSPSAATGAGYTLSPPRSQGLRVSSPPRPEAPAEPPPPVSSSGLWYLAALMGGGAFIVGWLIRRRRRGEPAA